MAPGGTVLLEEPYAVLPKDALSLKKVSKAGMPFSELADEDQALLLIGASIVHVIVALTFLAGA